MDARPSGPWMEAGREAGLVLSAQRGDVNAMLELLRNYQRPLWRMCFAFTREVVEGERLVQDTSRRALRNLKQVPVGQPFLPWLARIARTLAVARSRRRAGDDPASGPRRPNGDRWSSGALGAHDLEYQRAVLAAFGELSPDDQLLLAMRLFQRLPYSEIAKIGGLAQPTTMHRIATAREKIENAVRERLKGGEQAA
jgi:RNA polymerase sigma-70 factor (ECF subfamily)